MSRFLASLSAATALLLSPTVASGHWTQGQRSLRAQLAQDMQQAGGASGAYVIDLTTGRTLFSASSGTPRLPASVEKLYTTGTALIRFGPDAKLSTTARGIGRLGRHGGWHGRIYLRGGGDPTFGSASYDSSAYGLGATVQRLASNLRQAGIRSVHGAVIGDESYFDSLRGTPATGYAFSPYTEGLLSGLVYDRGLADEQGTSYQNRPALFAAQRFVDALRSAGVAVPAQTAIYTGHTPRRAAALARVHSPKIATLIRLTNTPSDNFFAEMLLKGIGARFGRGGTTAAGAAVVRSQVARSFGIHPQLEDGSGLSRNDLTSPRQVVTVLSSMDGNRAFKRSLAIAGETGTMQPGLQGTAAQGRCRGKTGTLHDVANLVGYCTARDGHELAFAFLLNSVDPTNGHALEDQMAVALARYNG